MKVVFVLPLVSQLDKMLDAYYALRRWDMNGIPGEEKLKERRLELCRNLSKAGFEMKVEIRLFGFLVKYSPEGNDSFSMELSENSKVKDVINALTIADDEARIVILNGRHAQEDAAVNDNDEIVLMTPIEGG